MQEDDVLHSPTRRFSAGALTENPKPYDSAPNSLKFSLNVNRAVHWELLRCICSTADVASSVT